ncbi:MAG TPA: AbiV family abortive infection protein [Bacteroidota bacterium]|nr:AbiV family abortive infection protein [Bacteroidota bacterium]
MVRNPKPSKTALTTRGVRHGIQLCITNAENLFETGNYLGVHKLYQMAIFSLCTAIEESGKALQLIDCYENIILKKDKKVISLPKSFYSHKAKLKEAIQVFAWDKYKWDKLGELTKQGGFQSKEFIQRINNLMFSWKFDPSPEVSRIFSERQKMLYVDMKNGKFSSPKRNASRQKYQSIFDVADKLIPSVRLNWVIALLSTRRGATRREFSEIALANLPAIIEEWKGVSQQGI